MTGELVSFCCRPYVSCFLEASTIIAYTALVNWIFKSGSYLLSAVASIVTILLSRVAHLRSESDSCWFAFVSSYFAKNSYKQLKNKKTHSFESILESLILLLVPVIIGGSKIEAVVLFLPAAFLQHIIHLNTQGSRENSNFPFKCTYTLLCAFKDSFSSGTKS